MSIKEQKRGAADLERGWGGGGGAPPAPGFPGRPVGGGACLPGPGVFLSPRGAVANPSSVSPAEMQQ